MSVDIKEHAIYPLAGPVTVSLAATAHTTLYTVPEGYKAVIDHVDIIGGASAGDATCTIGRNGTETDFLGAQTLSGIAADEDVIELRPIPAATPVKKKCYAAGIVIEIAVTATTGGAANQAYLWGYLIAV